MVEYSCGLCRTNYGSGDRALFSAKHCEGKGVLGLDIEGGLVLFGKDPVKKLDNFLVFYDTLDEIRSYDSPDGTKDHNKIYSVQNFELDKKKGVIKSWDYGPDFEMRGYLKNKIDFSDLREGFNEGVFRKVHMPTIKNMNLFLMNEGNLEGEIDWRFDYHKIKEFHNRIDLTEFKK